jgi:hypothetical protein
MAICTESLEVGRIAINFRPIDVVDVELTNVLRDEAAFFAIRFTELEPWPFFGSGNKLPFLPLFGRESLFIARIAS